MTDSKPPQRRVSEQRYADLYGRATFLENRAQDMALRADELRHKANTLHEAARELRILLNQIGGYTQDHVDDSASPPAEPLSPDLPTPRRRATRRLTTRLRPAR